jgi:phosphate-selective porin OprO/OprP
MVFVTGLTLSFFFFVVVARAYPLEENHSSNPEASATPEEEKVYRTLGVQAFWKDGVHLQGPLGKIKVSIRGWAKVDGGRLNGDDQIGRAFPGLMGQNAILRSLRGNGLAKFYDAVQWKVDVEFAQTLQIKENWVGAVEKLPYLGDVRVGYTKEPFSLEELTSSTALTFMEKALPSWAFASGSNLGFRVQNSAWNERMTWSAGGFWNVQSTAALGNQRDQIDQANGYDLGLRVSGLPRYEEDGKTLLHLGFAYTHRFPPGGGQMALRYRTRPETYLTSDTLVDTKQFSAGRADLFDLELAAAWGPLSYQAEGYYVMPGGGAAGAYNFWGFYGLGSFFLTGEPRPYNKSQGVFSRVKPRHDFHPFRGGWGAWELAARYSFLDLNDKDIQGGREKNITLGLNGYLNSYLQVMFNYIRIKVDGRGTTPPVGSGNADIFQTRIQLAF